jgi:hypothetical protein
LEARYEQISQIQARRLVVKIEKAEFLYSSTVQLFSDQNLIAQYRYEYGDGDVHHRKNWLPWLLLVLIATPDLTF